MELTEKEKKFLDQMKKTKKIGYIIFVVAISSSVFSLSSGFLLNDLHKITLGMFFGFSGIYLLASLRIRQKFLSIIEKLKN